MSNNKQTMSNNKTFPYHSAFPEVQEVPQFSSHTYGLTKREYFASNITVDIDDYGYEVAKQLMDSEAPKDRLKNIKWWMEAEARMKVLKADALIKALNNEQQ